MLVPPAPGSGDTAPPGSSTPLSSALTPALPGTSLPFDTLCIAAHQAGPCLGACPAHSFPRRCLLSLLPWSSSNANSSRKSSLTSELEQPLSKVTVRSSGGRGLTAARAPPPPRQQEGGASLSRRAALARAPLTTPSCQAGEGLPCPALLLTSLGASGKLCSPRSVPLCDGPDTPLCTHMPTCVHTHKQAYMPTRRHTHQHVHT